VGIKISIAGLVFIMGILSLWKENRKINNKKENKHDKKCRWIFNITIGSCMFGIVSLTIIEILSENSQKSNYVQIQKEKCDKAFSFACNQIGASSIKYFINRKNNVNKEISDKIFISDLKNNGDMFDKFLNLYKDQIDTGKIKIIIQTIGFLREYSDFIIKDTNCINTLNGLLRIIDTTKENEIPLFIDSRYLGK
jgi:hypothetical protein